MRLNLNLTIMALGVVLSTPVSAADPIPQQQLELMPQTLFSGVVSENDVGLLFSQVRAAVLAVAEGREAPPPSAELQRRLEAIEVELKARGLVAGMLLSHIAESTLREAVRELNSPSAVK